jgi:glutamate dehydrogenase
MLHPAFVSYIRNLSCAHTDLELYRLGANPRLCFEKYIDVYIQLLLSVAYMKLTDVLIGQCMLDLLIQDPSPGIKKCLADLYNKPEILFFGPDGAHIRVIWSILCSWYIFQRGLPI